MKKRSLLRIALGLMIALSSTLGASSAPEYWLVLKRDKLTVGVDKSLSLAIYDDAAGEII